MRVLGVLAILVLGFLGVTRSAHAGMWYYELAGGVTHFSEQDTFYDTTSGATSFGIALDNALFYGLGKDGAPVELQIGLQDRYSSASSADGITYLYQALYPVVRLQLSKFYLAGGATPLLWKHAGTSGGITDMSYASGSVSFLGETGLLWSLTPTFSVGLNIALQTASSSSELSPKPVADGTLSFRFYFGGHSGKGSSNEFEGWRYPFGFIK